MIMFASIFFAADVEYVQHLFPKTNFMTYMCYIFPKKDINFVMLAINAIRLYLKFYYEIHRFPLWCILHRCPYGRGRQLA